MNIKTYVTPHAFAACMLILSSPLAAAGDIKTCLSKKAYESATSPIENVWARKYARYKQYSTIGGAFDEVGRKYNLDPALLYAILLNESATGSSQKGRIMPWPYTIRDNKGNVYRFLRPEKAKKKLNELLAESKLIDVGPAQINLKWNGRRVKRPEMLMDLKCSLEVVSSILKEKMKRKRDPLHYIIGRYYSSRPSMFERYGMRIYAVWNKLIEMENHSLGENRNK